MAEGGLKNGLEDWVDIGALKGGGFKNGNNLQKVVKKIPKMCIAAKLLEYKYK